MTYNMGLVSKLGEVRIIFLLVDWHSSMLSLMDCLALKIQNLLNWNFEWSDTCPQLSRQSLTISNFLPSEDDAQQLKKRAILYMMEFLATEFKSLVDLKHLIPNSLYIQSRSQ